MNNFINKFFKKEDMQISVISNDTQIISSIGLRYAVLCIECEIIYDTRTTKNCPICGSKICFNVQKAMDNIDPYMKNYNKGEQHVVT